MLKLEKFSQQKISGTLELFNNTAEKQIICIHKETLASNWIFVGLKMVKMINDHSIDMTINSWKQI